MRPQLSMEPGGERKSSPSTKIQPKWKSDMLIMEATTESKLTPFDRSGLILPPTPVFFSPFPSHQCTIKFLNRAVNLIAPFCVI